MSFFGKQDNEKLLQYDDVAFLHFFTSLAVVCILGIILNIVFTWFNAVKSTRKYNYLLKQTLLFRNQILNQNQRQEHKLFSMKIVIKIIAIFVLCFLVYACVNVIQNQQTRMISFDPYQIMGVSPTVTISQIKKAFRKLALQYHPDRNKNNPQASAKFLMISKAYQCLTQEDKRQNCIKFGNPDGNTAFQVGIGLPSIVIDPQNQNIVLFCSIILLLVIVPSVFLYWNNNLQAHDTVTNLLIDDIPVLYRYMTPQMTSDIFILMLGSLKELNVQSRMPQQQQIKALISKIVELRIINPLHLDLIPKPYLKKILDILQHLKGVKPSNQLGQAIEKNLAKIMRLVLLFCRKINQQKSLVDEKYPIQFLGIDKFRLFLEFQRKLYNGLYKGPISCALQLIDLNQQQVINIRTNPQKYSITQLIKSNQLRKQFLTQFIAQDRRKFVQQQILNVSLIDLTIKVTLLDQQVNTVKIKQRAVIKYTIKKLNKTTGYCHLSKYPYMKQQKLYFLFIYENNLIAFKQVQFKGKDIYQGEFPYTQSFPKKVNFIAKVVSDVYYGTDVQKQVPINVILDEEINKESAIHHQDMFIERMPKGVLQSVLTLDFGPDSDRELSDGQGEDQPTVMNIKKKYKINPQASRINQRTMSLEKNFNKQSNVTS